jgi:hypothetical protein
MDEGASSIYPFNPVGARDLSLRVRLRQSPVFYHPSLPSVALWKGLEARSADTLEMGLENG